MHLYLLLLLFFSVDVQNAILIKVAEFLHTYHFIALCLLQTKQKKPMNVILKYLINYFKLISFLMLQKPLHKEKKEIKKKKEKIQTNKKSNKPEAIPLDSL